MRKIVLVLIFVLLLGAGKSNQALASVCDRSEKIVITLEQMLRKPCELIDSQDLESLEYFILANSGLKELKENDFAGFSRVERLSIESNELEVLPKNIFASLKSLKTLNLSGNNFKELRKHSFGFHPQLENLTLSFNRDDFIFDVDFLSQFSRDKLCISIYDSKFIPAGFFALSSRLKMVVLKLETTNIGDFEYNTMKNLEVHSVRIIGSKLIDLPSDFFVYLSHVEDLELVLWSFRKWSSDLLRALTNTKVLNLFSNSLSYIPQDLFDYNHELVSLSFLVQGQQNLSITRRLTEKLRRLKRLHFLNNGFSEIESGAFDHLQELEELAVHATKITNFPTNFIYHLKNLKELIIGFNQIDYLDPQMINPSFISSSIESVYIAGNPLSSQNVEALKAMLPNKVIFY